MEFNFDTDFVVPRPVVIFRYLALSPSKVDTKFDLNADLNCREVGL